MKAPIILVDQVSKKYKIFPSNQARILEFLHPFKKIYHKEFWALREISFEIPQGKTYGLVGRNGSGKSTLLQILAGVLQPTHGEVTTQGRISALLELGAGFNPNFTGIDNVILNGVVTGLSKQEVAKKLPAIIEFSELGDFVNQPVRTYSSGMYIRLAFSAAIHVDPEILIVDEALAVGDARFQRKCFRKFEQFRKEGKTIFLVTHDTNAIVRHCDTTILMEGGRMLDMGDPKDIVNRYVALIHAPEEVREKMPAEKAKLPTKEIPHIGYQAATPPIEKTPLARFLIEKCTEDRCPQRKSFNRHEHRYGNRKAEILDYCLVCNDEFDPAIILSHEQVDFYIKVLFYEAIELPIYGLTIKRLDGVEVYGSNSLYETAAVQSPKAGDFVVFKVSLKMSLIDGDYFISLGIAEQTTNEAIPLDRRYDLIHLKVHQTNRTFGIVDLQADFFEHGILS